MLLYGKHLQKRFVHTVLCASLSSLHCMWHNIGILSILSQWEWLHMAKSPQISHAKGLSLPNISWAVCHWWSDRHECCSMIKMISFTVQEFTHHLVLYFSHVPLFPSLLFLYKPRKKVSYKIAIFMCMLSHRFFFNKVHDHNLQNSVPLLSIPIFIAWWYPKYRIKCLFCMSDVKMPKTQVK